MTSELVLVDANFLIAWLGSNAGDGMRQRAERFVNRLIARHACIVIPAPAMAEYFVQSKISDLVIFNDLIGKPWILIGPFDYMAAIELHLIENAARGNGDKRDGIEAPWQKIKIDRQIVAIGRAHRCDLIVTDDHGVAAASVRAGIPTSSIDDLDTVQMRAAHHRPASAMHAARRGLRSVREQTEALNASS